jgi:hypothetical protein
MVALECINTVDIKGGRYDAAEGVVQASSCSGSEADVRKFHKKYLQMTVRYGA